MFQPFFSFLSSLRDIGEEGYETLLKKPLFLLGDQGAKVREMFLGMPRKQAVTIYAGVLWVIPIAMVQPYTSLYMVSLGLSETEVGVYQNLMKIVGVVCLFLGGYLSDAWSRKKTLILFDALSWGGYCFSLALADSKWWCVSAIVFLATNAGAGVPYQCLLGEGVAAKKQTYVYTVLQMVNLAPFLFFFPLLGGLWVSKMGLGPANHAMYWFFTVMVTVGIFLRWKYLPETVEGENRDTSWNYLFTISWFHVFRDGFRQFREELGKFFKKPGSRFFFSSKFLDEWMIYIWGIYSSLYMVHYLGMKESYLSILTQGSAYVAFLTLFLIIPTITESQMVKLLGADQVFAFGSLTVLIFLSPGSDNVLIVCLLSACLGAVGGALFGSVSAAVWMSLIEEKQRAKVVAAFYALAQVGIAVTGNGGAYLYGKVSPLSLLWVMIGMRVVSFVLLRRVARVLQSS